MCTCDSRAVHVVTAGHFWPPTLRQTTAMTPAPSALAWERRKGPGRRGPSHPWASRPGGEGQRGRLQALSPSVPGQLRSTPS